MESRLIFGSLPKNSSFCGKRCVSHARSRQVFRGEILPPLPLPGRSKRPQIASIHGLSMRCRNAALLQLTHVFLDFGDTRDSFHDGLERRCSNTFDPHTPCRHEILQERQTGDHCNPDNNGQLDSMLFQQQLECVSCAGNSTLPDLPVAILKMKAAHAARAARGTHTGDGQPSGERLPPLFRVVFRDASRWCISFCSR